MLGACYEVDGHKLNSLSLDFSHAGALGVVMFVGEISQQLLKHPLCNPVHRYLTNTLTLHQPNIIISAYFHASSQKDSQCRVRDKGGGSKRFY